MNLTAHPHGTKIKGAAAAHIDGILDHTSYDRDRVRDCLFRQAFALPAATAQKCVAQLRNMRNGQRLYSDITYIRQKIRMQDIYILIV